MRGNAIWTVALAVALTAGCGKSDEKNEGGDETEAADEAEATESQSEAEAEPEDEEESEAEAESEDEEESEAEADAEVPRVITPADIDPEQPIAVDEFASRIALLDEGATYRVVGYPSFFLGDTDQVGDRLSLATEAGVKNTEAAIECRMAEKDQTEVSNAELVAVVGTMKGPTMSKEKRRIDLTDCKLEGKADAYPADAPVVAGGDEAVAAGALRDLYYAWLETEVAVVGSSWGVTTSKRPKTDEVIDIRIDVATRDGDKLLGCHLAEQPPKLTGKARHGVVFRGTFAGFVFDKPQLEPCELGNR